MDLINIGIMGIIIEGGGLMAGTLLLYLFRINNPRLMGMLFGGTSGIMIAMICFDILPEALQSGRMEMVFVGIIIGMLLGLLMDESLPQIQDKLGGRHDELEKIGLILIIGLGLHNLPEGFALGTVANSDKNSISQFALIMAIHSIPEGIALAIPFKKGGTSLVKVLIMNLLLGVSMGVGAILGYSLSGVSSSYISIGLGIASGIILYIVCEELMPESKKIWNGRMTTVAVIFGIMFGIFLIC